MYSIYIFEAIFYESLATVHSLMKYTQLIDSCQAHLSVHRTHSSEVTLMFLLKASHTRVARAKQAPCLLHWLTVFKLAVPLFRLPFIRLYFKYKTV